MGAGFECYNQNGVLQFDGINSSLAFRQKITRTINNGSSTSASSNLFGYPRAGFIAPVVVWTSDFPIYLQRAANFDDSNYIYYQAVVASSDQTKTATVTLYFFDFTRAAVAPSNAGLQLYDASANLIFDAMASGGKYFRGVDIGPAGGLTYSYSAPAGKVYAIGQASPLIYVDKSGSTYRVNIGAGKSDGSTCVGSPFFYYGEGSGQFTTTLPAQGSWLVADVTGY